MLCGLRDQAPIYLLDNSFYGNGSTFVIVCGCLQLDQGFFKEKDMLSLSGACLFYG